MNQLQYLIQELQNGNDSAFDKIYNLTKRPLFFVSYSILKDKNECEDVLQEVYIKFYNNKSIFNAEKSVFNWLYTVTKNQSLNRIKQLQRNISIDFIENIEDDENDIEKNIRGKNLLSLAEKNLSQEEFLILTLSVINGFKRREIAEMLDKPISTITWIYNTAIKKMQIVLKGENDED